MMRRYPAEQHALVIGVSFFAAFGGWLLSILVFITLWPFSGSVLWGITIGLAVATFLGAMIFCYRSIPPATAPLKATVHGLMMGDRFVSWPEIALSDNSNIMSVQTITLHTGERLSFFRPQDSNALNCLALRRISTLAPPIKLLATLRRQRIFWGMVLLVGLALVAVPSLKGVAGALCTVGLTLFLLGFSKEQPHRRERDPKFDEPPELEFLEPGVLYRDKRGKEFRIDRDQLRVTFKGTTTTFPAEPTRSVYVPEGKQIVHLHRNSDGKRMSYCRQSLERFVS
jgi:hypothetical protein